MADTASVHAHFHDDVRRWFQRRAPADRVDDLVQEAFLRIHRGLPSLRDQERVAPWVFRVCRSVWIDAARRERPHEELPPLLVEPDEPDATERVAGWLPFFVETLPPTYREAVRLSELEGLSQAEVARRLGLSASGARSRVQRGRRLLRQSLEDCCRIGFEGGEVVAIDPRSCGCESSSDIC